MENSSHPITERSWNQLYSVNPNDYVVGLAEISFPLSFFNIDTCPFQIYVPGNSSYQQAIDVTVEGKRYVSGAHLVREMQRVISNALPIGHSVKDRS